MQEAISRDLRASRKGRRQAKIHTDKETKHKTNFALIHSVCLFSVKHEHILRVAHHLTPAANSATFCAIAF